MKQFTHFSKSLLATLVLLCISIVAAAETVEINGVFYNLQNSWCYYYNEGERTWISSTYYNNAAIVTYNPDTDVNNPGSVETYSGDLEIPATVSHQGTEYSVVAVNDYAFANCRALTSLKLPSSVVFISNYAFRYCAGLTSISMPGVECLGNICCSPRDIFENCSLTTITLPKSLKYIADEVFISSNFSSINVDEENSSFISIDGVLYDKNVTKIAAFPGKKGGTYKIPTTITTIKSYTFPKGTILDELIVPANVTRFESYSFYSNPNIKKLTIEDSENELFFGQGNASYLGMNDEFGNYQSGNSTFNSIDELYWGRNIKFSTYSPAFAGSPLKSIEIGPKVTEIQKYTFYNCNAPTTLNIKGGFMQWCNLDFTEQDTDPMRGSTNTKVTFNGEELSGDFVIPDAVTKIPAHGLQYGCSKVTSLTIHAGVTEIEDGAFKGLSSLKTVTLADGNTNFKLNDNVLYNKEVTKILLFPQLRAGDYTVPATITEIGAYQFYKCAKLTGVILPNSLSLIGENAFAECTGITSIKIPASVVKIAGGAFDNCKALSNITIEDSNNPLELNSFFHSCPTETIYIGRNLKRSDGVMMTDFGYTFNENTLTNVGIGSKVTSLPSYLFYNCRSIKKVVFDGTLIDWCNITFADQYATPFGGHMESSPDGGWYSKGPSPILYVRVDPQPDPSVEHYPLHSQVNIPEGATKVGAYSFFGQNGVSNITIPTTMTVIETYAFVGVNDVYIKATNIISLPNVNSFDNKTFIYTADATGYKSAPDWSPIADRIYPLGFLTVTVDLIAMGTSPALLPALNALEKVDGEYRIEALTNLKIRGTMNGWDFMMIRNKMPNLRYLDLSEAVILTNDGGIEYYQGYHTKQDTITTNTFYQLKNLKNVILPEGIKAIESNAFAESGITSMVINEGIKTIGYSAFANCYNLTDLTLGKGLETIEGYAFSNCTNLKKLVLPTTLKRIGYYAFNYCTSLTDIDFAEGLTTIESGAFQSCSSLNDVRLPTSLRRIEGNAFQYCGNLRQVRVPSMLESIGDYAFTGCGLNSVYAYTIIPIQINQNTFDYDGVQLYVPDNSFYAYYMNTQWGRFLRVNELDMTKEEYKYSAWYTARNTDIEITTDKPIRGDEATGYMYPGSGLIITGNGEQLVKKLILEWNHGSNYPSLIENGNLNVDELAFIMNVYPRRWYFFCFPCDMDIQNLKFGGKGKYVWRYYDPELRAQGKSGWTNFTGTTLKAGVGYIYQCNVEGTIELPAYNPDYLVSGNKGTAEDKEVNLVSSEATNPQDASWNFVGNPNLSYYSLDDMEADFNSPITVWNDENQTYEAVVPGDDDYDIHPFQAFFIQKPADSEGVTFKAENRATYNQATEKAAARRRARATRAADENHMIVNVEISNGTATDKTRVVFDDSKSFDYELGTDASKMMSMAEVPQIYTLDNKNAKYSVNNRPNKGNEVRLGFSAPVDGNYTTSAPRMDIRMSLKDKATGTIHDFSNGEYTFQAEAGFNDTRFALVLTKGTTNISEEGIEGLDIVPENGGIRVSGNIEQPVNIYNVKGMRVATLIEAGNVNLANGTYIVSVGNKNTKVLVK